MSRQRFSAKQARGEAGVKQIRPKRRMSPRIQNCTGCGRFVPSPSYDDCRHCGWDNRP